MTNHSMRPLADTLESLGIEELKERLEISPVLVGTGSEDTENPDIENCCSCKMPQTDDAHDEGMYE